MPKVYIAAAFRRFSDRSDTSKAYGEVINSNYVAFLEAIEDIFVEHGFDTCLPHRDEGLWGRNYYEPDAISALCYRHVETSDVIFALAEGGRGVHLEIGYAAGLGNKTLLLMCRQGEEPSTLIHGLPGLRSRWPELDPSPQSVITAECRSDADLLQKLRAILSSNPLEQHFEVPTRQHKALIDIGSHTVKLKIVSLRGIAPPRISHEARNSLGLLADVDRLGSLQDSTVSALIELLTAWRETCTLQYQCCNIRVVGTAALRKANNARAVLQRIANETSFRIEILRPEDELDHTYSAVRRTFRRDLPLAVLNLGGGSTQIGIGSGKQVEARLLLDFGTRQLAQQWPWVQPVDEGDYNDMLDYVERKIAGLLPTIKSRPQCLIHTGGELDFLLRCQVPMTTSKHSPAHVSQISTLRFSEFSRQFSKLPPDTVAASSGLNSAWLSGAVASNVIAVAVARQLNIPEIVPSNLNVSDGLLVEQPDNYPLPV